MKRYRYPHQNLSLVNSKGEQWKDIPGLEGYFKISNFARVKRSEYEMQYRNGAIYTKPEKIIKPRIVRQKNNWKKDHTCFLVSRVTVNGIRYNLTLSRVVYYCFVKPFDLTNQKILIICRDTDGLNVVPHNLVQATLSEKAQRIVKRGRMNSPFNHLSPALKEKQRAAIVKKISKPVSQYSMDGKKIKTYTSMSAAERATGIFASSIGLIASGRKISAGGYIWRWGKENRVDMEAFTKKRKMAYRMKHGQKVTQYDFKGNKTGQFYSIPDAAAATGTNAGAIRLVLKGEYKSAKGFFWKKGFGKDRIDLSGYLFGKESMAATQSKKVQQCTLTGTYLKTYPSIKAAADAVQVIPSCIIAACKGKQKTSAGYTWKYA